MSDHARDIWLAHVAHCAVCFIGWWSGQAECWWLSGMCAIAAIAGLPALVWFQLFGGRCYDR